MENPGAACCRYLAAVFVLFGFLVRVEGVGAEEVFYRSNSLGIQYEQIPSEKRDTYPYVLVVDEQGAREIRTLYAESEVEQRWEDTFFGDGSLKEERHYQAGFLNRVVQYHPDGTVNQETDFRGGKQSNRTKYYFDTEGIEKKAVYDEQDVLLYEEHYSLSVRNTLREVRRDWANGDTQISFYRFDGGKLQEEIHVSGEFTYVMRFDLSGRLAYKGSWKNGVIQRRWEYRYDPQTENVSFIEEENYVENTRTLQHFRRDGKMVKEEVLVQDKSAEIYEYQWNVNGLQIQVRRRSSEGIEEWSYTYDEEDNLSKEVYTRRGRIELITYHISGDTRIEEIYREGQLLMKVFYEKDERTREEFYKNGKLIRARDYTSK